ncbi:hypothetical protein LGV61_07720 [Desulfurispirillum indicum]|uniref:hypothetical protein n=1 Tax=Desulfurispirillum indicum TaxID=936456 RepID=UPI001CFADC85|nr:hypothetical protein [Desulfurispirillum indicum]UCZ55618.1 hypothetical protein LGV61_07720 [Desulfurispirillum indicum]
MTLILKRLMEMLCIQIGLTAIETLSAVLPLLLPPHVLSHSRVFAFIRGKIPCLSFASLAAWREVCLSLFFRGLRAFRGSISSCLFTTPLRTQGETYIHFSSVFIRVIRVK